MCDLLVEGIERRRARLLAPAARCRTRCPTAATCPARSPPSTSCSPSPMCSAVTVRGVIESRHPDSTANGTIRPSRSPEPRWRGWARSAVRTGRPVTLRAHPHDEPPGLSERVIGFAKEENATGGATSVRRRPPAASACCSASTPARSFDRAPAWRELRQLINGRKLVAIRDAGVPLAVDRRGRRGRHPVDLTRSTSSPTAGRADDLDPSTTLGAEARRRGVSMRPRRTSTSCSTPTARSSCSYPILNQRLDAVGSRCSTTRSSRSDWPTPAPTSGRSSTPASRRASSRTGSASAGAGRSSEAIRRLTSDTADLFGLRDRGRLRPGRRPTSTSSTSTALGAAAADLRARLPPGCRPLRAAAPTGYDCTSVNGAVFMEDGEHTGELAGQLLRNAAAV